MRYISDSQRNFVYCKQWQTEWELCSW